MTTKISINYTDVERQKIVEALRATALAEAELWDVLRDVEAEHSCSIEYDDQLISELAGEYDTPPEFGDVDVDAVWDSFLQHSEVSE